jgi:hypothetical protein
MPKKIKNIVVTTTMTQEANAWSQVLSHRNKLLENSDWTQLPDGGLTETNRRLWSDWRRELKRVNKRNFGDKDVAETAIANLEKVRPHSVYEDESLLSGNLLSVEHHLGKRKDSVTQYLNRQFNNALQTQAFESNFAMVDEEFEEASLYNSRIDSLADFPLLALEMELTGNTVDAVIDSFKDRKKQKLRSMLILKRKFVFFKQAIQAASSMLEYDHIEKDIRTWISTLT